MQCRAKDWRGPRYCCSGGTATSRGWRNTRGPRDWRPLFRRNDNNQRPTEHKRAKRQERPLFLRNDNNQRPVEHKRAKRQKRPMSRRNGNIQRPVEYKRSAGSSQKSFWSTKRCGTSEAKTTCVSTGQSDMQQNCEHSMQSADVAEEKTVFGSGYRHASNAPHYWTPKRRSTNDTSYADGTTETWQAIVPPERRHRGAIFGAQPEPDAGEFW